MSERRQPLVLLDSTVLVHLLRGDATGRWIEDAYHLTSRRDRPLLSTVAEGEVRGLALGWGWGSRKLDELERLLQQLVIVEAGLPAIVHCYAELYVEATRGGHPAGENDLWIAATAMVTQAELFTCDQDFGWLNAVHLPVRYITERA